MSVILKKMTVRVEAKKDFHKSPALKLVELISIANSTPAIGAPKVHVTPTATAEAKN